MQKRLSFLCPFRRMAFIRAFQMILIILMVASMPFLQSSHRTANKTTMAEATSTIKMELESYSRLFNRLRGGGSVLIVEKREVPTGPDPLHHNNNPTKP